MDTLLSGIDELDTLSVKFLLKGIPDDPTISENNIRMALRQKKYFTRWVMLHFMDSRSALVSLRVPRKSKNTDFIIYVKGHTVKAVKLLDVEELEFELMLNSTTVQMFLSASNLRSTVEKAITEMIQVENHDLFLGAAGDIKHELLAATSQDYELYPFGSRFVGLGFKRSDCDIFVDMGNNYRGGGETKMENSIQLIRDKIKNGKAFSDFVLIPRARIPVLKVKHRKSNVHCDISTVNGIGVENSKLLRNYLSDRRIRFVVTAVKVWARQLSLTQAGMGQGAFSSYCLVWLVLYALMQDSPAAVAPVVKLKKAFKGRRLFVDGWDCSFCSSSHPKTMNKRNELQLLHYVFNFYGSLNLEDVKNNVICPYVGIMIPVKQFIKTDSLPDVFENYKKQVRTHRFYEMSIASFVRVQDPVEQGHNIAKAVDDWVLDRFLKLCKTTSQSMENNMRKELQTVETSNTRASS